MFKNKKTNSKGITLIALVITIIVLLILAGVSIAALTSDNGIVKQAQNAKKETEKANMEERIDQVIIEVEGTHRNPTLNDVIDGLIEEGVIGSAQDVNKETGSITTKDPSYVIDGKLDEYLGNLGEEGKPTDQGTLGTVTGNETTNTVVKDNLGNEVKVPAGFKVVNPEETVPDGIIIEDVSHEATKGSQFVWIPVGEITKKDKTKVTINLSRYTFDETTGQETNHGNNPIKRDDADQYNFEELATSDKGNTTAKNIEEFKTKVTASKGYYIGRYEARDKNTTEARTDTTNDTNQLICTADNYVYNWVTQPQAADLSRNMYSDSNFESDLINSYAWDTAIVFLQACDNRENKEKPYSIQVSINDNATETKGTNNLSKSDKICNIYDMASNTEEWSTETYGDGSTPCTGRGGRWYYITNTHQRYTGFLNDKWDYHCFRPILYL